MKDRAQIQIEGFLDTRLELANDGSFPIPELIAAQREAETDTELQSNAVELAQLGLSYYLSHDFKAALEVYNQAISQFPDIAFFYACRWIINTTLEDDEGAFYDYQVAKKLDFHYHSLIEWLENKPFLSEIEAENTQIKELLLRIQAEGASADLYQKLALEYVHGFDYLKAIQLYSQALDIEAQAAIYVFRGAVYTKLIQYAEALADFNAAITLDATYINAYIFRAKLYESLGAIDLAFHDYEQAIQLNPSLSVIYEERASLYERLDRLPAALYDYNILVDLVKDDFYPLTLRADIKERMEDWHGALSDYSAAIALNPYYSDLYQYRAGIKERLGDLKGAEQDYAKFEELEEED